MNTGHSVLFEMVPRDFSRSLVTPQSDLGPKHGDNKTKRDKMDGAMNW